MAKEYRIDDLIGSEELYHHGIKGQKWGVRRFQKKDGSLTPAGRKRYDDDGPKKKQSKIPKTKSMHRINLEDKYQKQGMSKEQAEQAAAKRIRTEQIVAASAAVAVTAAIAYKKHLDNGRDFVINKDKSLNRVIRLDDGADPYKGAREYVSFKKMDNIKYRGMMGTFEGDTAKAINKGIDKNKERNPGMKITQKYQQMYNMTITPKQDVKVASINRAKNTFLDLYKNDPDFKSSYDSYMKNIAKEKSAHGSFKKFAKAIEKGEVSDAFLKSTGYKAFNVNIAETNESSLKLQSKFYEALKKQGMNAVMDMYDKKGPMKSKAPIITFDGDFDYSKRVLSDGEIKKNLAAAVPVILAQNLAKPAAMAFVASYGSNQVSKSKKANEVVRNYKQEHPGTELSDKEILDMLMKDED